MCQKILLTPSLIDLDNPQNIPWNDYKEEAKRVIFNTGNPWWLDNPGVYDEADMVERIGNRGMVFHPVLLDGKGKRKDNVLGMHLLSLDFDNKGASDTQPKKRKLVAYIDQQCRKFAVDYLCIYQTFSYKPSYEKVRVLIRLPFYLDIREHSLMLNFLWAFLNQVFEGNMDDAAQKLTQPFIGGKGLIQYHPGAVWQLDKSLVAFEAYWKQTRRITQAEYDEKWATLMHFKMEQHEAKETCEKAKPSISETPSKDDPEIAATNTLAPGEYLASMDPKLFKSRRLALPIYILECANRRESNEVNFTYNHGEIVHSLRLLPDTPNSKASRRGRKKSIPQLTTKNIKDRDCDHPKVYHRLTDLSQAHLHQNCQLFHNVLEHRYMPYDARVLAAMTFSHIKGGSTMMDAYLHAPDVLQHAHNRIDLNQIQRNGYAPPLCKKGSDIRCPYYDNCQLAQQYDGKFNPVFALERKLHQHITRLEAPKAGVDMATYRKALEAALRAFLFDAGEDFSNDAICLVQAPPGSGKTHCTLKLLHELLERHPKQKVTLAFPTHDLKDEVYGQFSQDYTGRLFIAKSNKPPQLPRSYQAQLDVIQQREGRGLLKLYQQALEDKSLSMSRQIEIRQYIQSIYQLQRAPVQFVTHKKLVNTPRHGKAITIIDESIHKELVQFQRISYRGLRAFQELMFKHFDKPHLPKNVQGLALQLWLKVMPLLNQVFHQMEAPFAPLKQEEKLSLSETEIMLLITHCKMDEPLYALLTCDYFSYDYDPKTKAEFINCINVRTERFPKGPVLLLSSTANENFYRTLFPKRPVRTLDLPPLQPKGNVLLVNDDTYSRSQVRKHIKAHESRLVEFCDRHAVDRIITFKQFIRQVADVRCFNGNPKLPCYRNFGDVEGYNELVGKNLIIFGKYSVNPRYFKDLAYAMGLKVQPEDFAMKQRYVQFNGFGFTIFTYSHDDLVQLHLHLMNEALEQAVGRARILTEDCTVYVFANFPVKGAVLYEESAEVEVEA